MDKYNKYEWLKQRDPYGYDLDEPDDWTHMSNMPQGWEMAFGELMCEELDHAITAAGLQDEFTVLQIKEKYAGLRFYYSPSTPEIDDIVAKYECISQHVCQICGRVDVPTVDFHWVAVLCEDCYEEHINCTKSYEEVVCGNAKMPNVRKYRQYGNEFEKGWKDFEVDISETVEKIKKHWKERQSNLEKKETLEDFKNED